MGREQFGDRTDAGRRLAIEVGCRVGIPSAVAAVSPGGGLVALAVARAFARPLLFACCTPLSIPWADEPGPEFGAVDEDGHAVLDYAVLAAHRISTQEIDEARRRALGEIGRFYAAGPFSRIASVLPVPRLLLVDDVLSPGWRMEAAVAYARRRGVKRVIVAAAGASRGTASWFQSDVDGLVVLAVDDDPTAPREYFAAASLEELRARLSGVSRSTPLIETIR